MSARNEQKKKQTPSQVVPQVLSLSQVADRLGVGRHLLGEWVRLGLVPMPYTLGQRRNGRTVAYAFLQTDLPELTRLVEQLKKGVVPR